MTIKTICVWIIDGIMKAARPELHQCSRKSAAKPRREVYITKCLFINKKEKCVQKININVSSQFTRWTAGTLVCIDVHDIGNNLMYAAAVEHWWAKRMTRARRRLTWPSRMDMTLLLRSLRPLWASRHSTECPNHAAHLPGSPTNLSELVQSSLLLLLIDKVCTFAPSFAGQKSWVTNGHKWCIKLKHN